MTPFVLFGLALWVALLWTVPLVAWRRARRDRAGVGARAPGVDRAPGEVLLVRPCAGAPAWLEAALASTGRAQGLSGATVRFTVDRPDDPARPIAEAVAAELRVRGLDAKVLVLGGPGANRKAAQLLAAVEHHPRVRRLVVADADVDLTDFDLAPLLAALDAPAAPSVRTAAVWQPVVETDPETPADHASAALLSASLHAFPLLGHLDRQGLVGKLFAVDAVAGRAGLRAGLDVLGEDMAMATSLQAQGRTGRVRPGAARSFARGRTDADVVSRYTRWIQVIRTQRPSRLASYPLLFLGPWTLVVAALGVLPWAPGAAAAVIAGALGARLFTAAVARRLSQASNRLSPADLVRADLLLLRAFLGALRTREVAWAGRRLQRGAGGTWVEGGAP